MVTPSKGGSQNATCPPHLVTTFCEIQFLSLGRLGQISQAAQMVGTIFQNLLLPEADSSPTPVSKLPTARQAPGAGVTYHLAKRKRLASPGTGEGGRLSRS